MAPEIRTLEEDGNDVIGYWDNPAEYPSWLVPLLKPGIYQVETESSTGHGPSAFDVSVAGQTLHHS